MENHLGSLLAFLSSVTWSLGVTTYSRLSREHAGYLIGASRALLALPLFLAYEIATQGLNQGLVNLLSFQQIHIFWLAGSIASSFVVGDTLFFLSTHTLGIPAGLALASIFPIWSALLGWAFRNENLKALQWLGILVVVAGTCAVIMAGYHQSDIKTHFWKGVLFALSASLLWSFNTFAIAQGGTEHSTALVGAVRMASALVLCPMAFRFRFGHWRFSVPKKQLLKFSWLFALEGFGGSFFFAYGLTHAPLAIGSVLSSLSPVITAIWALFFGTETASVLRIGGILAVVVGLFLLA